MEHLSENLASEIKTIGNQMAAPDAAGNELQNVGSLVVDEQKDLYSVEVTGSTW